MNKRLCDRLFNSLFAIAVRKKAYAAVLLLPALLLAGPAAWAQTYDVIIANGRVVDGTGNPWYRADIGVTDGVITAIGDLEDADADRVVDASGMVVSPGFIDLHVHTQLLGNPMAQSKVRQGVTIDVMGEGSTVAPRDGLEDRGWETFTEYFNLLEEQGISMNIISHVSEGQIRRVVKGFDTSAATPAEMRRMEELLERSLQEGAWGLMTAFGSGGPAHPDEVVALAQIASDYDTGYYSHIGSEGYEQQEELDFAFRVAEEADIPVHILHLKVRGRELWDEMPDYVNQIQAARDRGLDITANQYPYTAMAHPWSANFPEWMQEDGRERFVERLNDLSLRDRIKNDPEFIAYVNEHGGWEGIVMSRANSSENSQYEGMSVAEIAEARGNDDPADTMISLMAEENGSIMGVYHNQSEENVRLVMRKPWVAHASDGSAIGVDAPGVPHPRNYGTNARVLGHYVREEGVLTLEEAVRKMTSLPAQILGLDDRGLLREGLAADIVVFDAETVRATNTFEEPKSYAAGVPYVLVNGTLVVDGGDHTGARPGRVLRGPGYTGGEM